jgi:hypothetical protein
MVIYQNFAEPEVRDPEAYRLGQRGVRVSGDSLLQHLRRFSAAYFDEMEEKLERKIGGTGVVTHHGVGMIAGAAIFIAALVVDFFIVKEFWTWALSNENGDLQNALRDSVVFKSLQVVFATMAIHFMLTNIGSFGRAAYTIFICVLTIGMITGIGLLWATNSLPPGATLFGVDIHGSANAVNDTLRQLGLDAPAAASGGNGIITSEAIKTYQTVIWLGALSVLFLIVASVGALALEMAIRNFTGMTGGAMHDTNSVAVKSQSMRDELARVRAERDRLNEDAIAFWRQKISEFVASYTTGVLSQNFSTGQTQDLIDNVNEAAKNAENRLDELT